MEWSAPCLASTSEQSNQSASEKTGAIHSAGSLSILLRSAAKGVERE